MLSTDTMDSEDKNNYVDDIHSKYSLDGEVAAIYPVFNNGVIKSYNFIATHNCSRYCQVPNCGQDVYEADILFICEECYQPCYRECYIDVSTPLPFALNFRDLSAHDSPGSTLAPIVERLCEIDVSTQVHDVIVRIMHVGAIKSVNPKRVKGERVK